MIQISCNWYMFTSSDGFKQRQFGYAGTVPITGDFDGDGDMDIAVGDYDWIDPDTSGSEQGEVYIYLNH